MNAVFEKQHIKINSEAENLKKEFNENGYCIIEKSELPVEKFAEVIDFLFKGEGVQLVYQVLSVVPVPVLSLKIMSQLSSVNCVTLAWSLIGVGRKSEELLLC